MCSPHIRSTELRSTSLRAEHLYGNYLGFFYMGDLCILLHLLICSILSLYPYGLKEIYFILEVTIQCYFVSFVAQVFPALAIASSFSQLLCQAQYFCFISTPLLSGISKRCSRLILYILSLCPKISHFFRKCLLFLLEDGISNQDLDADYVHCY